MDCSPILALLALCSIAPEAPPAALPLVEERPAVASCMSKEQARTAYRTSHLYWHGSAHCWNNSPGRTSRPSTPSAASKPRSKPVTLSVVADANANPAQAPAEPDKAEIFYPPLLKAQAAIASDLYSMRRPITEWPMMLELDITGPDLEHGIDGCCWPPLESLK